MIFNSLYLKRIPFVIWIYFIVGELYFLYRISCGDEFLVVFTSVVELDGGFSMALALIPNLTKLMVIAFFQQ
ncbi:hypothetical protein DZB84_04605 [Bacillus sp. HNG]|nr:hypothetical protein DZB84_04605 [Bacillus sp. HNG]